MMLRFVSCSVLAHLPILLRKISALTAQRQTAAHYGETNTFELKRGGLGVRFGRQSYPYPPLTPKPQEIGGIKEPDYITVVYCSNWSHALIGCFCLQERLALINLSKSIMQFLPYSTILFNILRMYL